MTKLIALLCTILCVSACGGRYETAPPDAVAAAPEKQTPCSDGFEQCAAEPAAVLSCLDGQCSCAIVASGVGAPSAGITSACRLY